MLGHRHSTTDKIVAELLARIDLGIYRPGDRLPTQCRLAQAVGTSRPTLSKALAVLLERGTLKRLDGEIIVAPLDS